MVLILMGVSGSGKTTVGKELARLLKWPFFEADEYHPPSNLAKMSSGKPLSEEDRLLWLQILSGLIRKWLSRDENALLACSALSRRSRCLLRGKSQPVRFVYLKGARGLIRQRLAARQGHFMPSGLLDSQFEALQAPRNALVADAAASPQKIAQQVADWLADEDAECC
ncbi:MAG: gluconokinase [Acidobacteriota bacterium]